MNRQALLDWWTMFRREHDNVSVDRMVCDPKLRAAFLEFAGSVLANATEEHILWAIMGLRKGKLLLPRNSGKSSSE
jgi:hypothetical protein